MPTGTRGRRTAAPKPAPAPEPEEVENEENGRAVRAAGEMHELFADFVTEETGIEVTAEQVFAIISRRNDFRKSDEYAEYRQRKSEERAEAAEERAERRAARSSKTTEPAEEEAEEAPAKTTRSRRPAAARGRNLKAVETEEEAPAPKPAGRRRGRAKAPEETPF